MRRRVRGQLAHGGQDGGHGRVGRAEDELHRIVHELEERFEIALEILVENGDQVEYDQPLFLVKKG